MKLKVLEPKLCPILLTPWTVACWAPLSMGFCRQEYWSGCRSLLQGIFSTQGSNPGLLHCRQILYHLSYQWSLGKVSRGLMNEETDPSVSEVWVQSLINAWGLEVHSQWSVEMGDVRSVLLGTHGTSFWDLGELGDKQLVSGLRRRSQACQSESKRKLDVLCGFVSQWQQKTRKMHFLTILKTEPQQEGWKGVSYQSRVFQSHWVPSPLGLH